MGLNRSNGSIGRLPVVRSRSVLADLDPELHGLPVQEAFRFYGDHYDRLGLWILEPGKRFFLGDKGNRRCRFCGERSPEVTFRKDAHAVPELLGNKSLFTYYECDGCNDFFGRGIENDFGSWSKPMRTIARIRGKNGVPTIKRTDQGWRIEGIPEGLNVKHEEDDDPPFEVNEAKKEMVFKLTRDPYTPVAVLKAFVKMGLILLSHVDLSFSGSGDRNGRRVE